MWPNGSAIYLRQDDSCSFDHLVGKREELVWNIDTKRLGGLEIDYKRELCRLYYGQVGRLGALQDTPGVDADLPICIFNACAVTHQTARGGVPPFSEHYGNPMTSRPCNQVACLA